MSKTGFDDADWRTAYSGPAGRKQARRELMLGDHGILRRFYDNTHEVSPGKVWRSYQPSPERLGQWKERGIKTVVNLRGEAPSGFLYLEEEACRELGLALVPFRAWSREAPPKAFLHGAKALFERIEYPALFHCKSGADRAGVMSLLYHYLHERRPLAEAMEQLSFRYGHVKQGKTGVIDAAFADFIQYTDGIGKSRDDLDVFYHWVDTVYDPDKIKQEFRSNMWGRLLTETILRRE